MGILVINETFDEWSMAKNEVQNSYNIWFDKWAEKDTEPSFKETEIILQL